MPFGLHGAPATFQRMVNRLLDGLERCSAAYIDDVIIFSHTWPDHLLDLKEVLERVRAAGLTVKRKKCQFGMNECLYLGHLVGSGKVRPEQVKMQAVWEFKRPKTKTHVQAFLGLTGYYRKFIHQCAMLAAPLTDLIRKMAPVGVVWTPECEDSFGKLKEALCSSPVLASPQLDQEFMLQTDASERGVGAVLSQIGNDGLDHPLAYFSRKLLPREERYYTIEKECLPIKLGVQAFHVYLMGRPFLIQTDHRSLEWLNRLKETNARLMRWSLFLQGYSYRVNYQSGQSNSNADALSRGW